MRSDLWYYYWGEAAARGPAHLILLWPITSPPPLSLSLCHSLFKSLLRPLQASWDGAARWRWGASLKGIITVSPEDVHNHSVKQTGVGREECTFPFDFLLEFLAPAQFHTTASGKSCCTRSPSNIMELKEGSFKNTVLSLLSGGPRPLSPRWLGGPRAHLSVLLEPLGAVWAGWLSDSMIVWSGVFWRQCRVIAPCPVSVGFVLRRLLWAGAAKYSLPGLGVLCLALGQRLDLWRRPVLIRGWSQWPVAWRPLQNAYLRWGCCW